MESFHLYLFLNSIDVYILLRSPNILSHLSAIIAFLFFAEKPRGRQLRENVGLGAGALAAQHLHRAQHGAAPAVLQCPQPGLQQQSHKPTRRTLREPCPLLKHLPE